MNSRKTPFGYDPEDQGTNTRIDYSIRAGGRTARESVVLQGRMELSDVEALASVLPDGRFVPSDLGLPDLLSRLSEDAGDALHHIDRISPAAARPSPHALTADQVLAMAEELLEAAPRAPELA